MRPEGLQLNEVLNGLEVSEFVVVGARMPQHLRRHRLLGADAPQVLQPATVVPVIY